MVDVAVPLPLRRNFTYAIPEEMLSAAVPGVRVLVPFRKRMLTGVILRTAENAPQGEEIRPLRRILDPQPALSAALLSLLEWAAQYYFQPMGELIKAALPPGMYLQARECFALTERGLKNMESFAADTPQGKILRVLKRRGGQGDLSRLLTPEMGAALQELITAAYVQKEEDSFAQKIRIKKAACLRFLNKQLEGALKPPEEEALAFLEKRREVPLREFKGQFKRAASLAAKFVKLKLAEIVQVETYRLPAWEGTEEWISDAPACLTEGQEKALGEIIPALQAGKFHPFLLHGVTGSGKTEVYLRAISEAVQMGKQALLLVPEIALTAQLVAYFRSRGSWPLAVLHSRLSPGERYDEWRRIRRGEAALVIGVRSAVFAPLSRSGIIIVDEEHDPSYKQQEKVLYHARDLALVRAKMEDAVALLGSATPSLESYYNARQKKFRLLSLPSRIDDRSLPQVQVMDMRQEKREGRERPVFSRELEEALRQNQEKGEQSLLFLNRRGFSAFALCRDCGFVYQCPNCSVSLHYHLADKDFRCHYCDYAIPATASCPKCSSPDLGLFGVGTQRLEEEIKKKLPGARLARMDRDTTARKSSHQRILGQVRRGEVNLLIGTQMITKGHDLPRITLVGVPAADLSLNIPDFRSGERTFQLLTQVAGRAGRGPLPGKVIIQTYNPGHYSIQLACAQDFGAFYEKEAGLRREMGYPPFLRLIHLRLEGNAEGRVESCAEALGETARRLLHEEKRFTGQVEVLGPASPPLSRLRGKYRRQMLLKGKNWSILHDFTEKLIALHPQKSRRSGVKLIIDVDPIHML